ncbi:MAG: sulfotransferase domain-containing protein [Rhodospirillales bacterium]|nr:sulfotransferase domain-containing protein [Rhodospirillales bacterium]
MALTLIHCSYHKCLTSYYYKVMSRLFNLCLPLSGGYTHFNSLVNRFYSEQKKYKIASVNNHCIDLSRYDDQTLRLTRFIRDPRDLVISGYFYHKRAAEPWCKIANPKELDWEVVNGNIPQQLSNGQSYAEYLQSVDIEDGIIGEIDFRKKHFVGMAQWPERDNILTIRYEDIIGNEREIFDRLFSFYEFNKLERTIGMYLVDRYSARRRQGTVKHIRSPQPGQWQKHFTPRVKDYFDQEHGGLLKKLGYTW